MHPPEDSDFKNEDMNTLRCSVTYTKSKPGSEPEVICEKWGLHFYNQDIFICVLLVLDR